MKPAAGPTRDETLRLTVDNFWETFPPFWHRIRAYIRQAATEQFDISVEQFHILRNIRRGECTVSDLASAKNISRAAISQGVNILVNRGLISRTTDPQDRRHIHLTLTDSGNALLDDVSIRTRRWMMGALSPLNDDEIESLNLAMEALKRLESA